MAGGPQGDRPTSLTSPFRLDSLLSWFFHPQAPACGHHPSLHSAFWGAGPHVSPGAPQCGTPALTTPRFRLYRPPPTPCPAVRHSGAGLTGAGRRGRVGGRACVAVLAHAERGRVFQGPAVLWARRAEGPPGGHLVKPWGTGCGEELREQGATPQPLSSPLSRLGWGCVAAFSNSLNPHNNLRSALYPHFKNEGTKAQRG